jgi:hypothetical protein
MVDVVDIWTGRTANALRQALRMTHEGFAAKLGTSVRGVAKWSAEPDVVPVTELQRALDTMLSQSTEDTKSRFRMLHASGSPIATPGVSTSASPEDLATDLKLDRDPATADLLDWLDMRAGWSAGTTRLRVRATLNYRDEQRSRAIARARAEVPRSEIAATLACFYDVQGSDMITFSANVDGEGQADTSIVTRPEWLDLRLVLGVGDDQLQLRSASPASRLPIDELVADAAVERIAYMVAIGTRFANRPLYQLRQLEVDNRRLSGEVALTDVTTYALTMDLLEHETLDAIVTAGNSTTLPLRSRLLPSLDVLKDIGSRLCVGGPLALFAAARPGTRIRGGEPDYMLLVQQRSNHVINAAGRLAVIPKSFHEPLIDFSDDAQLSATLERELEAELFGREDVDATIGMHRHAEPFHLTRLSEPMRWLIDHTDPGQWRMECTGFGFNLVSGNFEFASLIVIDDEEWWNRYGGQVEANWETQGLRRYSSRDRSSLANLVHDEAWSNEGLFAFAQGLNRLGETGGDRVKLPAITAEA